MDFIRFSIQNPVKVAVAVLLVLLFGVIALFTIPVQLVPNVDQPIITIATTWVGRSPEEVERRIIEEQEDKVKGVANLKKMTATASQGSAEIKLEFYVGTNMARALQEVSDKLREVPSYPAEVDQPVITVADSASENAIAWMVLTSDDPAFDVAGLYDEADRRIKPYLERVPGVAEVNIYGGRERQVHVKVNPVAMAERGVTFGKLESALRRENVNVSAGDIKDGRLDVRIRTVGQYDDVKEVRDTIVAYGPDGPIHVHDVAQVELTLEKQRAFVNSKGQPALAINAIRETGANVVSVMRELRQRVAEVNRDVLPNMGPRLKLTQVYDETIYIDDALALVRDNLWQGGILTILVLLFFLRVSRAPVVTILGVAVMLASLVAAFVLPASTMQTVAFATLGVSLLIVLATSAPTGIISLAIPTSIIGTFVVLTGMGRNINVVSLAGLAFAIGMVVDNAIVVLENIDRHLSMGKPPFRAAYDGTREVWSAILASTLTTLVVFLPVVTIQEEAGQLFLDLSLAICAAVALSLIVAVAVIPPAAARWLKPRRVNTNPVVKSFEGLFGIAAVLGWLNRVFANLIYWATGSWIARVAIVFVFTAGSAYLSYTMMPPTDYLPKGNRNLVFGFMLTPPAYNLEQSALLGERMESKLRPYWEAKGYADLVTQPPVLHPFTMQPVSNIAPIENFFFVSFNGRVFFGAASSDKSNVAPLTALLPWSAAENPGVIPLAFQTSLFGNGFAGGNSVEVEISGNELSQVRSAASALYLQLIAKYSPFKVQTDPLNFDLAGPELKVRTDRVRAADLGVDVDSVGLAVQTLVDGVKVGDYRYRGDTIDLLMVRDPSLPLTIDDLARVPIAIPETAGGGTVPLDSVTQMRIGEAPQQIKRIEQLRSVTLTVAAPDGVPLEQVTREIDEIVQPMKSAGQIPQGIDVAYAGTADKLSQVREAFLGKWYGWTGASLYSIITSRIFLALLVCYLVMAAVFESFLYPFVIMFSVPFATVGGFLGLRLVHELDPNQLLDVVTMLGFVILIGTVVNNAILIVAQSLNFMQGFGESEQDKLEKRMSPREAIKESVRTRMRPVMMTTITTLFGMLPLVIKPGAGSELYRGLGGVVLGGLLVATVFTLFVVPMVFSIVFDIKVAIYRALGWTVRELGEQESLDSQIPQASA